MNPEAEARTAQVAKLRSIAERLQSGQGLGEEMSPRTLAVHIQQAANQIEDWPVLDESDKFRDAWARFHECLKELDAMMSDCFKAPEQSIELIPPLLSACWELQVEWVAMRRH